MNQCFISFIDHILFIHSSIDGHQGCFPWLGIVNKQQWTFTYKNIFEYLLSILLKHIPWSKFACFKHLPRSGITESCGDSKVYVFDEPLIGIWMDSCARIVSLLAASHSLIPSAHCQQKFIDAIPWLINFQELPNMWNDNWQSSRALANILVSSYLSSVCSIFP